MVFIKGYSGPQGVAGVQIQPFDTEAGGKTLKRLQKPFCDPAFAECGSNVKTLHFAGRAQMRQRTIEDAAHRSGVVVGKQDTALRIGYVA